MDENPLRFALETANHLTSSTLSHTHTQHNDFNQKSHVYIPIIHLVVVVVGSAVVAVVVVVSVVQMHSLVHLEEEVVV